MIDSILILFLFVCSVLVSAMERSVLLLSISDKENAGSKNIDSRTTRYLKDSQKLLGAFYLSKLLLTTGTAVCVYHSAGKLLTDLPQKYLLVYSAVFCAFLFFISFLFSRLLVARSAIPFVYTFSPLMVVCYIVFLPVTRLYSAVSSWFDKKAGTRHPVLSMDEISRALDLTKNADTNPEEHKLLKGIINFGNMDITRIMQPKMDIVAFDFNTPFREIITRIQESGYSRVPVFRDKLDQIVGVLYIKDLLAHLNDADDFNWQALLRPCFFIPENMKPDDLLREFQQKKTHLAIVVDEFGQTTGLVTLEDIIEEIVGEISDEFDEEDIAWSKLDDNNFVFEGKISMNDFLRILDKDAAPIIELKSDSDTLSGFIIERAGHFPKKNEKLNWENFTFNIESADSRRIKRVKVTIRRR